MRNGIVIAIAFAIVLVGCGKTEVAGQVFTGSGSKLNKASGLQVFVVNSNLPINQKQIENNIQLANKYYENKVKVYLSNKSQHDALLTHHAVLSDLEGWIKPVDPQLLPTTKRLLESIDERLKVIRVQLETEYSELMRGIHPIIFYGDRPSNAILVTNTDAEGRYKISLDESASKLIVAKHDGRYWFLSFPEKSTELNLNDNNAFGSKCDSCFLDNLKLPEQGSENIRKLINVKNVDSYSSNDIMAHQNEIDESKKLIKDMKKAVQIIAEVPVQLTLANAVGGVYGATKERDARISEINATEKILKGRDKLKDQEEVFSKYVSGLYASVE